MSTPTVHRLTVHDVAEAISRAAKAPTWASPASRNGDMSFTGTAKFGDAVTIARTGWPEGRARIQRATAAIAAASKHTPAPFLQMDVAGAYPVAAIAAAGDPACMVSPEPIEDSRRPAIRLTYEAGYSCAYGTKQVENFGAAVAAYVDAAEDAGFRVELTAIYNARTHDSTERIQIRIPVKQADEALDMDRVAFMTSHPSAFRRIAFGLFEQLPKAERRFSMGYGTPCQPLPGDIEDGEIYLPGLNIFGPKDPDLSDPVRTFQRLGPIIQQRLTDIDAPIPPLAFAGDVDTDA